jgi:hypothetical protein
MLTITQCYNILLRCTLFLLILQNALLLLLAPAAAVAAVCAGPARCSLHLSLPRLAWRWGS